MAGHPWCSKKIASSGRLRFYPNLTQKNFFAGTLHTNWNSKSEICFLNGDARAVRYRMFAPVEIDSMKYTRHMSARASSITRSWLTQKCSLLVKKAAINSIYLDRDEMLEEGLSLSLFREEVQNYWNWGNFEKVWWGCSWIMRGEHTTSDVVLEPKKVIPPFSGLLRLKF